MRKIIIAVLIGFSVFSCTKDTIKEVSYTEVILPDFMKTSLKSEGIGIEIVEGKIIALDENGNEVTGNIRFTFPDSNDNSIIKLEISNNIFELTALEPDFLLDAEKKGLFVNLKSSGCIQWCHEHREKGKGRGACKFDCWVQYIIAAAAVIIAALID